MMRPCRVQATPGRRRSGDRGTDRSEGRHARRARRHDQPPPRGLLQTIIEDKIDTTFLISHRLPLEKAAEGYKMFHDQQNEVTKIVLKPGMATA
jgi:threonine dehydrogenase-like Zn-dependent dehydrogenase